MLIGPADSADLAIAHCRKLSEFSDEAGVTTRLFLGAGMRGCLSYFEHWAERIGLEDVGLDRAGNFRALLRRGGGRRLLIGSHLDSVPHAGAFDGVLGVVMGMLLAESLRDQTIGCSIEMVGFSEEEGVRFQRPFIGSTALVSGLNDAFADLVDDEGISIRQAIANFGIDTAGLEKPQMERADAYLEFHIEQGPVLEKLELPLGIVTAIVGQTRAVIEFEGQANHAGTTPMELRRDALCAAAEWALAVEKRASSQPGLVATVGSMRIVPDAANVIPGQATLSLDLRHADDRLRRDAVEELLEAAREICLRRDLQMHAKVSLDQKAVPMNVDLVSGLEKACNEAGVVPHLMSSGAGHDAMIVAPHVPSAMVFVRTPGGLSHHPDEAVLVEDLAAAFRVGQAFVQNFS